MTPKKINFFTNASLNRRAWQCGKNRFFRGQRGGKCCELFQERPQTVSDRHQPEDDCRRSLRGTSNFIVVPAKAGVQRLQRIRAKALGPGFRRGDG